METKIVQKPDPVLSKPAKDVAKIDKKVADLIEALWKAHKKDVCLGVAAVQIGVPLNVAVIGFEPTEEQLKEEPRNKPIKRTVLINPRIISHSKEKFIEKEACLSIPKGHIDVPRYKVIQVEYLDESGKKQKIKAKGFVARVIQHEIDHLQGKTIADYQNTPHNHS